MDRVNIYEYDRKNRENIVKAIEANGGQIVSWSYFIKKESTFSFPSWNYSRIY